MHNDVTHVTYKYVITLGYVTFNTGYHTDSIHADKLF
jgi:hypothetical protein